MNAAILGAGMAGLGAAHRLRSEGVPAVIYEKRSHYGGHASSHRFDDGFVFDEGPHISFTKDERIQELFARNVADEFLSLDTQVNNYWKGYWIKHPAQCNLHGLPENLVVRVILDFVEASSRERPEIHNYADWLRAEFGDTFAETFPMEYGLKYHTTSAANMSTDWLGPRLYRPTLEEVLHGALSPRTPDVHYISHFRYPASGGFVSFIEPLAEASDIRLDHDVVGIDPAERRLTFANGREASYDYLISSVPLPELVPMIGGVPDEVVTASRGLACSELVVVNIGVDREDVLGAHWSYFYDRDIFFTRLSTPHRQSPANAPPGCGSLQAECYFSSKYRPRDGSPEECIEPVLRDLRRCGVLQDEDAILHRSALHIPYANVIFDLERADAVETVHGYLDELGIRYCGRYGEWAYIWTDESFKSGERAAEAVLD